MPVSYKRSITAKKEEAKDYPRKFHDPIGAFRRKVVYKDEKYSDGEHILYVNAEIDDGSRTAKLMKYFMTADPEDKSEGRLSERVHYLKCEEGGVQEMCKVTKSIWQDGWKDGERFGILAGKMEAAFNLEEMGMNVEKIAEAVGENVATVKEWLEDESPMKI